VRRNLLQHRFRKAAGLIFFAISLAAPSWIHADDEFKALPGLWKTTLTSATSAPATSPAVSWHCVDEGSDPWVNFAYIPASLDQSCKRTYTYRTSTSLRWRLDCAGPSTITDEGSIVFSAADHYTGKVELRGTLMGYPIAQTIMVEGKRYAACTSPQD
jgi:hypothetical protein